MVRTSKPEETHALDRRQPSPVAADVRNELEYFRTTVAPDYLPEIEDQVRRFVTKHAKLNRKIAIVTSGGTTVPLENNTVRFIDNFSAGTRGSASAEQFLENGYVVVFLHREFSLLPYSRHYSHSTNCFLDFMEESPDKTQILVRQNFKADMQKVLRKYRFAKDEDRLLCVPFTTVNQYLYTLRSIGTITSKVSSQSLFYLAAAVSDFFLPSSRISEHKIQSNGANQLTIELDPVPKFLRRLVEKWSSNAMVVSFKLETDKDILLQKCQGALKRYGHQLVIGNLLQTRKKEVIFVQEDSSHWIRLDDQQMKNGVEIESIFVPVVIDLHNKWIEKNADTQSAAS